MSTQEELPLRHANGLPRGWALATLPRLAGRAGFVTDGDWVETKDQDPDGGIRLTQLADVGVGTFRDRSSRWMNQDAAERLNCTFLAEGDVMVARMPDPLGRACLFPKRPEPCVTAVDVCIVRAPGVNGGWLMHFLNAPAVRSEVASYQTGSTRKRISRKNLCKIEIPTPPLPEQRRIVAEIDTQFTRLDAAVATLERVQANLQRARASVLKAAVEGRLVPTEAALARAERRDYETGEALLQRILEARRARWDEAQAGAGRKKKYQEPVGPETEGLPELPEGWCWVRLDTIAEIESGQTPKGITSTVRESGQVPWFRVGDMNLPGNEERMVHSRSWLSLSEADSLGLKIRPAGTIVFPKRGGAIATNKKRRLAAPSGYDLNTMGVVPDDRVASLLWVWFQQLDLASLSDGSNVPQLNNKDVAPLAVPLPPAAEQSRIAEEVDRRLSVLEAVNSAAAMSSSRCDRLRQSILKRAFEGRLVPQDPTDEPAEQLLARLAAT